MIFQKIQIVRQIGAIRTSPEKNAFRREARREGGTAAGTGSAMAGRWGGSAGRAVRPA
jgi:hypothetical protein